MRRMIHVPGFVVVIVWAVVAVAAVLQELRREREQ